MASDATSVTMARKLVSTAKVDCNLYNVTLTLARKIAGDDARDISSLETFAAQMLDGGFVGFAMLRINSDSYGERSLTH